MTIQLYDLDVPYEVATETTHEGKDVIMIRSNSALTDRDEDYNICLDYDGCQELIRTLQFISNEIKPKDK